ncbi:hypothetical protein [uncultured Aquimarina sp.]|uniref:hypothetical protein n=1 Tax=uncultured Aquimarina sp. TaxID=575652 RepID=UPI00262F1B17|nr:hypothetical protein [uncultured Aquimarina sp.]
MKIIYSFLVLLLLISCNSSPENKANAGNNLIKSDSLLSYKDFAETIENISDVKYAGNKYSDWMTNRGGFVDKLLELKITDYSIETKSYSYKDSCVFYIHNLSHNDKQISSIRPFLINTIGKTSYSKLSERVLIFALKNEKEANFIDIPPNWGYSTIRAELIENIYKNTNTVVISCDTTKICKFKDLRN